MRLEKWFISNLDDSQRKIIVQSIDDNIIVKGVAGSGKTNLAIHRALQAKGKGSYAIVIFTIALKRMIAYGMDALGLDKERIAYKWAWNNRGFDLTGAVYQERNNNSTLYLVNDLNIRKFERIKLPSYTLCFTNKVNPHFYDTFGCMVSWLEKIPCTSDVTEIQTYTDKFEQIPNDIVHLNGDNIWEDLKGDMYLEKGNSNRLYLVNDSKVKIFERIDMPIIYGLDFADWVEDKFYYAFGRRSSWFKETQYTSGFDLNDRDKFEQIPSGTIFKRIDEKIDYLIIDEAQDFNIKDYEDNICPKTQKSLSLFGDSAQQMNYKGSSIEGITEELKYKSFTLDYNYRLPKAIAKVAQQILKEPVDLLTNNLKDNGNSDYPNYPKPTITKYSSKEKELEGILAKIQMEDLDDVAILVPDESLVEEVNDFFEKHGVNTQVHYRTGRTVPFHTINTLDFSNNDLPCIITYYASKGSEFDNVFIPFANADTVERRQVSRNSFYVACTRASRHLYISFSGTKTQHLKGITPDYVNEMEA